MSNSKMVKYTRISPNQSGKRTHTIDRITPHCTAGQVTAETLGAIFASKKKAASSNYGIDKNGKVGMYVPESNRSWCSSSNANDQRAVTIECSSDAVHPYKMTDKVTKEGILVVCNFKEEQEICLDVEGECILSNYEKRTHTSGKYQPYECAVFKL